MERFAAEEFAAAGLTRFPAGLAFIVAGEAGAVSDVGAAETGAERTSGSEY
jgi:hypothetical protein